jgi:hypothetical protein
VPWNEADDLYLRHSINVIRQWATKATDLAEAEHHMTIIIEQAEVVIKSVRRGTTAWHDNAPMDYIEAVDPELLFSTSTKKEEVSERPANFEFAYFVSYSHKRGFGSSEFWRKTPIESYDDVQGLAKDIESDGRVKDVIILNWIRYPGSQSRPSTEGSPESTESPAEASRDERIPRG